MRKHSQRLLIVIFLLAFACCLYQEAGAVSISGPVKTVSAPSYKLDRATYIPLVLVCESHGLNWEWDAIGKVVVLKKNGLEVRLKVGSYRMYIDGKIKRLNKPPRLHKGIVVVPVSFAEKTVGEIFKEKKVSLDIDSIRRVLPSQRRYSVKTIVIDPGHGGKDPGAIAHGLKEKDIVLDIAKQLKGELEKAGLRVLLTRDKDIFIPLGKRAAIANNRGADFFISVHANAFRSRRAQGFEAYYLSEATDDNARAMAAAENAALQHEDICFIGHNKNLDATVWDLTLTENRRQSRELAESICGNVSSNLPTKTRGVKSARFYVLKGARMPAVLLEVGFISNWRDAENLKSSSYREKLAEALTDGVISYKQEYELTDGFTTK
jgi:N-acetylmuramoyl-L-alanine amidase